MASQELYYVPDGSKWPIIATLALFTSFLGGAVWFNGGDIGNLYYLLG
jgi:cytochrome c oxidase subunit 3